MKRTAGIILAALAVALCVATSCGKKETGIKIIAHRGYWTAPEAKNAQNSIKTLQLAQEYEIWGSEFDVRMTKDYFLVVNHDGDINGKSILDNNYEDIKDELQENALRLVETLQSFRVNTKIENISRGPTITRYELLPEKGTRVRSITNLVHDIALNLATTGVRIEAPIPGKSAVGIEVPNKKRTTVHLRTLIENDRFITAKG